MRNISIKTKPACLLGCPPGHSVSQGIRNIEGFKAEKIRHRRNSTMRKFSILIALILTMAVSACAFAAYPEKNINCVIQWGAGGGTDSLMRPLCSIAEKEVGKSLVMQNMTGGTGSIATQFVHDKPADGYTLLLGAENPALYQVLNISKLTYGDFEPVFLIGDETTGIIVRKGSKYKTFTDIVKDAKANPGKVKISTTGAGGLPWEMGAFITSVTGATFAQIPYDSDASARTAVINGECDFTVCKVQSGIESHKAGAIVFLTMFAKQPVAAMPEIPIVTKEYSNFDQYLPWGPFYGIFAKKGTDPAQIKFLSAAFAKAFQDPTYKDVLSKFNINALGYAGADAKKYITDWQSNTISALKKSGTVK